MRSHIRQRTARRPSKRHSEGFGPSFSNLPLEIKLLIVEEISEGSVARGEDDGDGLSESEGSVGTEEDDAEELSEGSVGSEEDDAEELSEGSVGSEEDEDHSEPTLRSLTLVNREFAALAQPFLWCFLDLSDEHVDDLDSFEDFMTTALPRVGHFIKSLALSQFESTTVGLGEVWSPPAQGRAGDSAPRTRHRVPSPRLDPDTAFIRRRSFLLAQAIASMSHLSTVRFDVRYLPIHPDFSELEDDDGHGLLEPGELQERRESVNAVPLALIAVGDRLTDLSLVHKEDARLQDIGFDAFDEASLASFLSWFTSLARLSLTFDLVSDSAGSEYLLSTIASLSHLRYLHIDSTDFFNDSFATAGWECPLETLSLAISPPLSVPAFTTLLAHFSSTLTSLQLDTIPSYTGPEDLSSTPFPLPYLHTLALGTDGDGDRVDLFLAGFDQSPLQYVAIDHCPSASCEAWEAFMASHEETLVQMKVSVPDSLWDDDVRLSTSWQTKLRTVCEAKGYIVGFWKNS